MQTARIMLCIDDPARRSRWQAAVGASSGLAVVGVSPADESGVLATAARQPDVVVVDSDRPGLEGAKLVGRLRSAAPRVGVLAVAASNDRPRSVLARALAADRYVEPEVDVTGLIPSLLEFVRERPGRVIAS